MRELSKKAEKAMNLSNQIINLLEEANEEETLEVIAVVSSVYSSLKAGFVVSATLNGACEAHIERIIETLDKSEHENFIEVLAGCQNVIEGSSRTIN
jgi:hypothetical protein